MYNRLMVGIFLCCKDEILFMKRAANKRLAPNMWSCIGGHMEVEDENDTEKALFRELFEETGIKKDTVKNLRLKYIDTRIKEEKEISNIYLYFADLEDKITPNICEEGSFYWLKYDEISSKEMSFNIKSMIEHYIKNIDDEHTYMCSVNKSNDKSRFIELK